MFLFAPLVAAAFFPLLLQQFPEVVSHHAYLIAAFDMSAPAMRDGRRVVIRARYCRSRVRIVAAHHSVDNRTFEVGWGLHKATANT